MVIINIKFTSICMPLSPLLHFAFLAAFFPFLCSLLDLQTRGPNLRTGKYEMRNNIKWRHIQETLQVLLETHLNLESVVASSLPGGGSGGGSGGGGDSVP